MLTSPLRERTEKKRLPAVEKQARRSATEANTGARAGAGSKSPEQPTLNQHMGSEPWYSTWGESPRAA
ncbi:hypothetical protein chiPu_0019686 [Chiloscyllium punctatum]|uniref:Uncharacterized protein n=1 Tax=Chiloscyllium punctatum TaxID=137246 RepID=A0A401RSU1_CHIPU|nr:hypothetical protein [Chiloscyllium punctatum]